MLQLSTSRHSLLVCNLLHGRTVGKPECGTKRPWEVVTSTGCVGAGAAGTGTGMGMGSVRGGRWGTLVLAVMVPVSIVSRGIRSYGRGQQLLEKELAAWQGCEDEVEHRLVLMHGNG